jgi:putative peptidoglycan lipid II flippase
VKQADPFGAREAPQHRGGGAAVLVAAGIFLSRLFGLVRQRAIAHFLGTSDASDAFTAALRIPNLLQNLFGEGVLSAAFIPMYAGLRARGDERAAGEAARAVLGMLGVVSSLLVLAGIATAPWIVAIIVPGFDPAKHALSVRLVRILFPGAAILVLSAWSLGVLNSHGRFFLSYVSPVLWNLAMILALVFGAGRDGDELMVVWLAWGAVAGSLLQLAVQLPGTASALGSLRPLWRPRWGPVQQVVRQFFPVFLGRGVAQVSAFVDVTVASLVGAGAVAILGYTQLLSMLPVSLFGMSVSAAELPVLSGIGATSGDAAGMRSRLEVAAGRMAFFVVPSAVAFLALGGDLATLVYGSGRFGHSDSLMVWSALGGSALGLVAATQSRLLSAAFYALNDTVTPLRFAVLRVLTGAGCGAILALLGPRLLGLEPRWGVAGITVGAGAAAWLEFRLLRGALSSRLGGLVVPGPRTAILWGCASLAAAVAWVVSWINSAAPDWLRIGLCLAMYAMVYWVLSWQLGVPEASELRERVFGKARRRRLDRAGG